MEGAKLSAKGRSPDDQVECRITLRVWIQVDEFLKSAMGDLAGECSCWRTSGRDERAMVNNASPNANYGSPKSLEE